MPRKIILFTFLSFISEYYGTRNLLKKPYFKKMKSSIMTALLSRSFNTCITFSVIGKTLPPFLKKILSSFIKNKIGPITLIFILIRVTYFLNATP